MKTPMTFRQIPKKIGIATIAITLLLASSGTMMGQTPTANALANSSKVAYVFDFGSGIGDTGGPGVGSSILVDAVDGTAIPSGGTYTTASGTTVTITDVPVSAVNAGGLSALTPFDTVIVYEVCDIGSSANANLMNALNSYLTNGDGKVVIFDGDRCSPIAAGSADYSTFLFPFLSNNPGPLGDSGTINTVENETAPATLTKGVLPGFYGSPIDAIGDSNTFTSNTGGWCAAIIGTNGQQVTGIQEGYARTSNGGLAIYNGQDFWFTFGPTSYNKNVFDNILDQPFNPDKLPCGLPVTGIKLDPATATNPAGTSHTVTATLTDINTDKPIVGVTVTFTVTSGPNAGKTGTAVTDASGIATFTYTDTGGAGTDTIVATFQDSTGVTHTSNIANKIWTVTPTTTTTASSQTSGSLIPGTPVTDSATVAAAGSGSLPDLTGTISFQLCGPNPTASTTANCVAAGTVPITTPNGGTFTATSPSQSPTAGGSYCWTATYSPDPKAVYSGSNSTTTTGECFGVLPSVTQGRMTGGGSIIDTSGIPNTRVTHGFELQCDVTKTPNNLQINWGNGSKFNLDNLTSAFCVNDPTVSPNPPAAGFNTYVGTGIGSFNGVAGYKAHWTFTDAGEPGTNDHAKIVITNGTGTTIVLDVSGNLQKGNQQAHNK